MKTEKSQQGISNWSVKWNKSLFKKGTFLLLFILGNYANYFRAQFSLTVVNRRIHIDFGKHNYVSASFYLRIKELISLHICCFPVGKDFIMESFEISFFPSVCWWIYISACLTANSTKKYLILHSFISNGMNKKMCWNKQHCANIKLTL